MEPAKFLVVKANANAVNVCVMVYPPEAAILRTRRRPKKSDGSARPSLEHSTRRASKKARKFITDMVVDDVPDAGTSSAMVTSGILIETRKDVWDAFGFTESNSKRVGSCSCFGRWLAECICAACWLRLTKPCKPSPHYCPSC